MSENMEMIMGEGNRTSFFKLFTGHKFRVVIPMLQREYAQGRDNVKEIRTEFLKALYGYLEENIPERDLDFIYGNVIGEDFIPLDGQQRLTTLFLLHWYMSRITKDSSLRQRFDDELLDEGRKHCRFTYKTRVSSQDFCDALMLNDIDFDNLLLATRVQDGKEVKYPSVKATMEDCNWFQLSWKYDPTIMSMLTMLDAIHSIFKDRADFFPRLLDTDKPIVTFLFMELEKYNLSDDLYIKMNSRGKPLTDFENFKARYSEHIGELLNKSSEKITRTRTLNDGSQLVLPLDKYFAESIDNSWTNMVWAYRNEEQSGSTDLGQQCDRRMANLIRSVLALNYLETHPLVKGENDKTFALLANQSGNQPFSFISLREGDALSLPSSVYLTDVFDILSADNGRPENKLDIKFRHCFSLAEIMKKILFTPRDLNYNERVMLYAYLGYILKYGVNDGLNQWMRVIYNLANAENNRIDSAPEVSSAIRSVRSLLEAAPSILTYLAQGKAVESFPSWLVEEERIKAGLILRESDGSQWLDSILSAERHGYFTGQIGFMLEFAGIVDYYKDRGDVNWSEVEKGWFERFTKYSNDAKAAFANSYEDRVNDFGCRFERAVLSKGNYLPSNNLHYNLLSTNTVKNNVKRDFTWKRLLRLDRNELATERRSFVKAVFDDPAYDYRRPNDSLKEVFTKNPTGEQWRDTLINCPSAILYCQQGFISFFWYISGCEGVLPMASSRLSGYHKELYSWALYQELKEEPSEPFKKGIDYADQKVNDALPFLFFDGFSLDGCNIWLKIVAETNPKDWSLSRFRLELIQEEDESSRNQEGGESLKTTERLLNSLTSLDELLLSEGFIKESGKEMKYIRYVADIPEAKMYLPILFGKLTETFGNK